MWDSVQIDPLDHPGQAEAVVAVEVGHRDAGDIGDRNPRVRHLPLRALAGIEEQALLAPSEQVPIVVALFGRHLARGAEDDEFAW